MPVSSPIQYFTACFLPSLTKATAVQNRRGMVPAAQGPERDFAHPLETEDLQVGVPEPAFLLGKARGDVVERGLAGRQHAVIARADHVNALFQCAGRMGLN